MSHFGAMIADASGVGLRYASRLIHGIPEGRFARLATPGGQVVQSNHPAFVLGHLCLYPVKVTHLLGYDSTTVKPPEGYEQLFSKDAKCVDDPTGSIYPPSEQIIQFFTTSYAVALEALRNANDAQLSAENPVDTPMKQLCPTLGSLLTFYMTGHVTTHLGQLSTWRRMEGLPAA
jgi:hypothetical protein